MKNLLVVALLVMATTACTGNIFEEQAFSEREYFDNDLTWAMNQAYWEESGFKGVCERRSRHAQALVPGSYLVTMEMKREFAPVGKKGHMILCKDSECVDSTGVIADKLTLFPESDLHYFGYDIKVGHD